MQKVPLTEELMFSANFEYIIDLPQQFSRISVLYMEQNVEHRETLLTVVVFSLVFKFDSLWNHKLQRVLN